MTAICLPPESDSQNGHAFFAAPEPTALTGSNPMTRGDSAPLAGKQPDPNGMTHSAPDGFHELVAR